MTCAASTDPRHGGKIGPNAVLQVTDALRAAGFAPQAPALFAAAGAQCWLAQPPSAMMDPFAAGRLHQAVRALLPPDQATTVMTDAGRRTADYLLAHRIPSAAQYVLRALPPWLSARLLTAAIRKHAWTFAGPGRFTARGYVFTLTGNPLCFGEKAPGPVCAWHAAVFERLFQALVHPSALVTETDCEASGAIACRFVIHWPP